MTSPYFYACFWYNTDCEIYNGCNNYKCVDNEVSFLDWVDCFATSLEIEECGDLNKLYYNCYVYSQCEGIVSEYWRDCFFRDSGC